LKSQTSQVGQNRVQRVYPSSERKVIYQNPPIEDSYPVNFRLQRTASPSEKNGARKLEDAIMDPQEEKRVRFFENGYRFTVDESV
jgi:hypothetical protein